MPNNNSFAHLLAVCFPGQWGMLMSPDGRRDPRSLPWAMDNSMFGAWAKLGYAVGLKVEPFLEHWSGNTFHEFLDWGLRFHRPRFVVVPDVPGNSKATLERYKCWAGAVERRGYQPAMAVQDGMTPADVPAGVVCFVGGSTEWKWKNVERFAGECERVHVGRVNTARRVWQCHRAGAESVDGSGMFRGDQKQLAGIIRYCKRIEHNLSEHDSEQLLLC